MEQRGGEAIGYNSGVGDEVFTGVTSVLAGNNSPLVSIMADPLAQAAALAGVDLASGPIARYLAASSNQNQVPCHDRDLPPRRRGH